MNWVEKQFARDKNMQDCPRALWQTVITAIEDACNSYSRVKSEPSVSIRRENGHAILVQIEFPRHFYPGMHNGVAVINDVRIAFDESQHLITAIINDKAPTKFPIQGDEVECYVTYQNSRIDADKLSEIALKCALEIPPKPPTPQRFGQNPPPGAWS
jgi:hypothetical protein